MTGEAAGQCHTGAGHSPHVPGATQGTEATLASLWVKPLQCSFIPWVLWPGRRQQKLQELRPGRRVPAPGGGSQVALWKRRSGHRWGQSQSWHPAALSRDEASQRGSACTPLCPAGRGCCQCPPQPSPTKPLRCLQQDMGAAGSALEGFSAPKGHRGHPTLPTGHPSPHSSYRACPAAVLSTHKLVTAGREPGFLQCFLSEAFPPFRCFLLLSGGL